MCFTIPGKVVFVTKDTSLATVDYGSEMREAKVIGQKIAVGDYVIVQAHFVVQKIPEKEALESIEMFTCKKNSTS